MRVLPLALALLLAACAERWEKPGATEADSDAAQAACTAQAAEQIKPGLDADPARLLGTRRDPLLDQPQWGHELHPSPAAAPPADL